MLFTASEFTSITSHIHNWLLFLLWLSLFVLSGVISSLFSSSILGTYQSGEFIFQCSTFWLFIPFMGFSRILKWFATPFFSGSCFARTLHHDPSILGGPTCMAHSFIELEKVVFHVSSLISFLWLLFSFCLSSVTQLSLTLCDPMDCM